MADVQHGQVVLEAKGLSREFQMRGRGWRATKRFVRAVTDVDLALRAGEVTAVVGESGSGKSVLARMLARIVTPTAGTLHLNGEAIDLGKRRTVDDARAVQLILQDPFASINPVRRISHTLRRPLALHGTAKDKIDDAVRAVLESVALTPAEDYRTRYPHELSGGQLQRVNIARGLAVNPSVLLADEPISMLDVSVRLGVLNLLRALCDDRMLAMLYITHDIASARYIADEIVVMYAGQVVERSRGTSVIDQPVHPYTQLLISSVPNPDDLSRQDRLPTAAPTVLASSLEGCRFAPRCPSAVDRCRTEVPEEVDLGDGHRVRCFLPEGVIAAAPVELRLTAPRP